MFLNRFLRDVERLRRIHFQNIIIPPRLHSHLHPVFAPLSLRQLHFLLADQSGQCLSVIHDRKFLMTVHLHQSLCSRHGRHRRNGHEQRRDALTHQLGLRGFPCDPIHKLIAQRQFDGYC